MKRTPIFKLILNIVVFLAYIISIYLYIKAYFSGTSDIFKTLTSFIAITSGYTLYIYNNSNNVFYWVNKLRSLCSRETVNWQMTFRSPKLTKSNLIEIQKEMISVLKSENTEILKDIERVESRLLKLKNSRGIESELDLRFNERTDGLYSVTILYTSQTSHKDIRKQWDFFRKILGESIRVVGQESNHNRKPYEEKSYYTVSLNMQKNPFYLLTIKTYDKPQNINFKLSFDVDNVKFESSNNKIVITTPDVTKVDGVLKDYVILGKVS